MKEQVADDIFSRMLQKEKFKIFQKATCNFQKTALY